METFLRAVLPKLLGDTHFTIHAFRGKDQLLKRLPSRLNGYAKWIPLDYRIVVLVDRDNEDCEKLKAQLEQIAFNAGLATRSQPSDDKFTVINRIVIEELEAWYFGDWRAVQNAYPRVSPAIPRQQRYRDPDAIQGAPGNSSKESCNGPATSRTVYARLKPRSLSVHTSTRRTIAHIVFSVFVMRSGN